MRIFRVIIAQNGLFYHIQGNHFQQVVRRCAEHPPSHKRCCVILLHISEEALRPDMSATCPHPTFNLQGYLMVGYGIVEPPPSLGVELILFYALHFQVSLTDDREDVSYLGRFRSLTAFLCRAVCFINHILLRSNLGF